ncbi:hypothetical protein [Sinorhizobium sp. BG8]|uniref:hypothetical protein n=1 Tax=Sinorhizobium sp. BG8 TaxID=2613773 RepID=UPI00193D6E58|nr:hypothetical protein [Sinorhizobium sp. BG8]
MEAPRDYPAEDHSGDLAAVRRNHLRTQLAMWSIIAVCILALLALTMGGDA